MFGSDNTSPFQTVSFHLCLLNTTQNLSQLLPSTHLTRMLPHSTILYPPRLRLIHGFLPPEEADWAFSKLLAELPWSQKTNYRQGRSTIMSPRIDHRPILYTQPIDVSKLNFLFLWVPCWHWKFLPIRMLGRQGSLVVRALD
jgi:hypothetical protein